MALLPLFEPDVSALPMKLVGRHCFLLWGNHLGWRQLLEATMTVGGAGLPASSWFPGRDSGFTGQNKAPSVGTDISYLLCKLCDVENQREKVS